MERATPDDQDAPLLGMIERVQKLLRTCEESSDSEFAHFCLKMAHALAPALFDLGEEAIRDHGSGTVETALQELRQLLDRHPPR